MVAANDYRAQAMFDSLKAIKIGTFCLRLSQSGCALSLRD